MTDLPTGTVTFLFTDIEGSTKLAQQYPDSMPDLLARHHEILRRCIETKNGYIFQIVGDSFSAAFPSALEALNAALDAQRCLLEEAWSPAPIKVRMGIHTGTVQVNEDNQYSGYTTLALTQRIMSAGHGGQVLLSAATRELVRDVLPADTELVDIGEKRLKDLFRPEHLYQLKGLNLPFKFPPLKTLDSFPNNLPTQLNSFIGRETEIAEVRQVLQEHSLVTLTGSGGTGKTRLSLQVAAELLEEFDHGVWFVELAPLADPDLIPQTILTTIGINEQGGKPTLELLQEFLQEKKTLIVLDNCEHLIEASARIVDTLLGAAPHLKVLSSSREALGVMGEVSYPVPSLSVPDIKHLPSIEQFSQYEAVQLFIDRASLVSPHFDVDRESAPFLAQICYRLDGIPLAIELAAARIRIMSVEQISKRLDDRFRLLTGGARTALPRQQTLRALIDWSYELLAEKERLLLRRLSVFAGGWTLEAAEDVCAWNGIDGYDVLDLLAQLVNKSLVVVMERSRAGESGIQPGGSLRYRMLETIRQYAREKLLESGTGEEIRERHFDYYLQTVRHAATEFFGPRELHWLAWLESEWDNLRAAVEWSFGARPQDGLELVNFLGHFLSDNWHVSDMENWLMELIPHPANSSRTARRAHGLQYWAQAILIGTNRVDFASPYLLLEDALSIYEELGDRHGIALCTLQKGHFYTWQGEPHRGSPLIEAALHMFREIGDKPWIAIALQMLGFSLEAHKTGSKLAYMQESLALYRDLGYVSGMIEVLKQLGATELRLGHFETAHVWIDEALAILQEHSAGLGKSKTAAYDAGDLAYYEGNYELAQEYYEDCLAWADRVASSVSIGYAKVRLGYLYLRRGELQESAESLRAALHLFRKTGNLYGINFTMQGAASLAIAGQHWEKAVPLFAYIEMQLSGQRSPVEQEEVDRDLAILRTSVDVKSFERLWNEGKEYTQEQAVHLALADL